MKVFEAIENITDDARGAVIAIGNFDGVHLGHQALLASAKKMADATHVPFGVLTFEPHPRALFRPDDPPFRITSVSLKHERLAQAGADFVVSLPFNWDFASQSADDFVENILRKGLAPAHVIVGADFRFGQLRKGCNETIAAHGIEVTPFAPVCGVNAEKYSSSDIRGALRIGDIEKANAILGWDWEIRGTIQRGDRRGHELGYPTANVPLGDILHPSYGIYATWVMIEGESQWRMAATNIGIRPMFELKVGQVEAHILDMEDTDIYGKKLRIRPVRRLRGEAKFTSLEALIEQIETDCAETRKILIGPCG